MSDESTTDDEPTAEETVPEDESAADEPTPADEPTAEEPAPDESTSTDGRAEYDAREDLPDVKTMPDGTPIKRSTHPVEWEAVGREALVDLLQNQRHDVERDVSEIVATLEVGTPVDPVHVLHVRDAIEALEVTVEERLVPVSRDKQPWERTIERIPDHRLLDALGLDREDVRELKRQREAREDESSETAESAAPG